MKPSGSTADFGDAGLVAGLHQTELLGAGAKQSQKVVHQIS